MLTTIFNTIFNASSNASSNASVKTASSLSEMVDAILGNSLSDGFINRLNENARADEAIVQAVGEYYQNPQAAQALMVAANNDNIAQAQALMTQIQAQLQQDFENTDAWENVPGEFLCSITLSIMREPMRVVTYVNNKPFVHHFEKNAINQWLSQHSDNPINRQEIVEITEDAALKARIQAFVTNTNPDQNQVAGQLQV